MSRTRSDLGAAAPRAAAAAFLLLLLGVLAAASLAAPADDEPVFITADQAEGSKDFTTLTGHVVLRQGTGTLTGETAYYDKVNHHENITGKVRYEDRTLTITALTADYFDQERKVIMNGGVVVTDTSGTVTASRVTYFRREGRMVLEGNVDARDHQRTVQANRLTYYRNTKEADAEGQVTLDDRENDALLRTTRVFYNRDTRFLRAPEASELRVRDQGKITLIHSDSLDYDGREKVARATGKVRIERDSLVAESGAAVMYRRDKRAVLTLEPRASDNHGSTRGDTLVVRWDDQEIRSLEARGTATVQYRSKTAPRKEETSEASGEGLTLEMRDQKARSLTVHGGVKNEFRSRNTSTGEQDVNSSEGDSMTVYFKDNEARLATVFGAHSGHYKYEPGSRKKKQGEEVRYAAQRVDYDLDRNTVYLRDEARMEYKDLVLQADSVRYDMDRSTLVASGNPRLKDPGQDIQGEQMGYDLTHKQGSVARGRTNYANGFYTGDDIKKVDDNVLNVHGGDYTTCDAEEPHYRIHSSSMKIYLHDKVVMRPVVFYVKDLPVLALPFYVFPIREGRHSGILFPQFDLGFSSTQGRFFRNAGYYWAMNDYADVAVYGDYYQGDFTQAQRWTMHLDGRYALRYLLNGQLLTSVSKSEGSTQWQVQGSHQHQLGERTSMSVSADFLSDAQYLQDQGLGLSPEARVSRNLHSLLALNHTWGGGSLSLALDRDQNLAVPDADSVSSVLDEQLPSLQVNFSSLALGRAADVNGKGGRRAFLASTYLSYSARLGREVHQTHLVRTDRSALGGTLGLSDNRRLMGWINLSPRLSLTHALVDEDALGNRRAMGAVWAASLNLGTTLYGTFQPHWGPFDGIRHVLSPNISYVYQPEFRNLTYLDTAGVRRSRFPGVAGVSLTATRQSRMFLGVDNTFQLKVKQAGEIKRLDNFAHLSLNTGYNFLASEQTAAGQPVRPWDQVTAAMQVYPGGVGSLDFSAVYDPYHTTGRAVSQLSFSTSLVRAGRASFGAPDSARQALPTVGVQRSGAEASPGAPGGPQAAAAGGNWNMNLAFSYSGSSYLSGTESVWQKSMRLNSRFSYQLSPNWHLDYSNQYDLTKGQAVYQEFTVQRQLHCWEARFSRRISPGNSEFFLRIGVKARPEIGYQFGQSGLGGLLGSGSPFGSLLGQ